MASNYELLLSSENELSILFFESLDYLLKMHKNLWKFIFTNKINDKNYEKINNKILFFTENAYKNHKDILDDCVWILSKDQPRANHLRYIISMIYSIKDMDALAKYPNKVLDNLNKNLKISKNLENLVNAYLQTFEKMIHLLKEKKIEETYNKSKILKEKFLKSYDSFMGKSFSNILKEEEKHFLEIYKVVKCLDKTIDHLFNLFDNFKFIKNKNKKTNKINLLK